MLAGTMRSVVGGIVGKPINLHDLPRLKASKALAGGIAIDGAIKIPSVDTPRLNFLTHLGRKALKKLRLELSVKAIVIPTIIKELGMCTHGTKYRL